MKRQNSYVNFWDNSRITQQSLEFKTRGVGVESGLELRGPGVVLLVAEEKWVEGHTQGISGADQGRTAGFHFALFPLLVVSPAGSGLKKKFQN